MLVLKRRPHERIIITAGDQRIEVELVEAEKGFARIGVIADESVTIWRKEIQDEIDRHSNAITGTHL